MEAYHLGWDCRSKEGEVTLLKAALVGRDINLRNSKAELISAQQALRDKEAELQANSPTKFPPRAGSITIRNLSHPSDLQDMWT